MSDEMSSAGFSIRACEAVTVTGFAVLDPCLVEDTYSCHDQGFGCTTDCGMPDGVEFLLQYSVSANCSQCWVPFMKDGEQVVLNSMNNPIEISGIPGTYRFIQNTENPVTNVQLAVSKNYQKNCGC